MWVEERKAGCAHVYLRRGQRYSYLEVNLIDCRAQGLELLSLARDVARLLYDRVISRSEAWARALQKHPIAGSQVLRQLLEFIERGEVTYAGNVKYPEVAPYYFKSPHVWVAASPSSVVVVAENRLVKKAVAEVAKLIEERLQAPRAHAKNPRGGSGGGQAPSQEPQ
jgi:hypothetical protein